MKTNRRTKKMAISEADREAQEIANKIRSVVGLGVKLVLGFIALMLIFGSWFTVSPGEVAIKTRFGKLIGTYSEGLNFKIPMIEGIEKFSIQIERSDIKTEAFSKDLQTMEAHLAVNHRIQQDTIASIFRNLGPRYVNTIIDPTVQEVLKSITAKYSAESIIANRMEVVKELNDVVKSKLLEKQIIVTDISIVDLSFQAAFMKAVEDKQVAEQQSLQSAKLVEKAKRDAEQAIAKARGEAESLRMQKEQVTSQMIELRRVEAQLKAIEKWNGVLPQYQMGGTIPFMQVGK